MADEADYDEVLTREMDEALDVLDRATQADMVELAGMVLDVIDIPTLAEMLVDPDAYELYISCEIRSLGMVKWLTRRLDGTGVLTPRVVTEMAEPSVAEYDTVAYLLGKYELTTKQYERLGLLWQESSTLELIYATADAHESGTWETAPDNPENDAPYKPKTFERDNDNGELDDILRYVRNTPMFSIWFDTFLLSVKNALFDESDGPLWTNHDYIDYVEDAMDRNALEVFKVFVENEHRHSDVVPGSSIWHGFNSAVESDNRASANYVLDNYEMSVAVYDEFLDTGPPGTIESQIIAPYRKKIETMRNWAVNGEWRPWTAKTYNTDYRRALRTLMLLAKA
jgi:hypothetical protein